MDSPDYPGTQFVQAKYYGKGRPYGPPIWIVFHTMEAGETNTRAESTAGYFANPGDGRTVSSTHCADNNSVVQCVLEKDSAYTCGNVANQLGLNWELAGYARQSRAEWTDDYSLDQFFTIAPYIRKQMDKYGIPMRRLTVDELKARKPGFTTHNDTRLAFGGTTHTDPGKDFPWDVVFEIIGGDMATAKELLTTDGIIETPKWHSSAPTNEYISMETALKIIMEEAHKANVQTYAVAELLAVTLAIKEQLNTISAGIVTEVQLDALAAKVAQLLHGIQFIAEIPS